jgi:hypothetical protein
VGFLDKHVRAEVARGELTCAEIIARLGPDEDRDRAWSIAADAMAGHLAAQAGWPAVTDNDRLTAAFAALDAAGIVAREHWTGTLSDGRYEIGTPAGRGYCFYHRQDEERCVAGGGLLIAYGTASDDGDVAAVGRAVAAALAAEGLTVEWDGTPEARIEVRMPWRVRRTGPLAAAPPSPLPADALRMMNVDRDGWDGPTAPPVRNVSAAVLAAYVPLLPAGAWVVASGDVVGIRFTRDGDGIVAVVETMELLVDDEAVFHPEPPVRVAPDAVWPLLRDRLR